MKFVTRFLSFIFIPKSARAKSAYLLLLIFIVAFFAAAFSFPSYWDRYAEKINSFADKTKVPVISKINIPHFYKLPFKLGLDLQGGAHLVYLADLLNTDPKDYAGSMSGLRNVIERRVNAFGVAEPNVQTGKVGGKYHLIVELAGVKDINQAIRMIGQTPFLEFKEERAKEETDKILEAQKNGEQLYEDPYFIPTGLNGKYLKRSEVTFDPTTYKPVVNLQFDDDGSKLFEDITRRNIGKNVAIYLDGAPISVPRVNDAISGGKAIITGDFSVTEAKELVQRLNSGALPVAIKLISQQNVEASLGESAVQKSLKSGIYAIAIVAIFMILWYKIPGVLAVLALLAYTFLALAVFKLMSVTLTLAGIVGFILSIGMAVDANILIFARMREESRLGKNAGQAVRDGFARAWPSIRDSNISTLLTCAVLYFFSASLVKGFAFTLALGVLISMFSAIFITRLLLETFMSEKLSRFKFLWYR